MPTTQPSFHVELLSQKTFDWALFTAATRMMLDEVKRPELLNYSQIKTLMRTMIEQKTAFVVFKDGEPVGAIGGLLCPNPYNPEITTLLEMMWYVLPKFRASRAGYLLLQSFIEAGTDLGAYDTTLSLLSSSEVNVKTLEKRGFKFEEMSFRKVN